MPDGWCRRTDLREKNGGEVGRIKFQRGGSDGSSQQARPRCVSIPRGLRCTHGCKCDDEKKKQKRNTFARRGSEFKTQCAPRKTCLLPSICAQERLPTPQSAPRVRPHPIRERKFSSSSDFQTGCRQPNTSSPIWQNSKGAASPQND